MAHPDAGRQISCLKWARPKYADQLTRRYGPEVDYRRIPAEDYAHATISYVNGDGEEAIVEATTSWSYVGAGLRLSFELLGPEYAMAANTLDTEAKVFLSREISGAAGEDLVERDIAIVAEDPAYTSLWGDQHWRKTPHQQQTEDVPTRCREQRDRATRPRAPGPATDGTAPEPERW